MKILIRQFLSQKHSWSYIGHDLAREFKNQGHHVDLFPTDGMNGVLPNDLKENVIGYTELNQTKVFGKEPDTNYDMQYSYTALRNTENYLKNADRRYVQWCAEWLSSKGKNILPQGFNLAYKYCDYILAPTTFVRDLQFIPGKIPENKIKVIPHGINVKSFQSEIKYNIPTNKNFKFLVNLQQTHIRKNLKGVLEAYGKAFSSKDDVCLVIKAKSKKPQSTTEFSLDEYLKSFYSKYKDHGEIRVISEFIPEISSLYNSIDCVLSLSHGEGFNMPILESLASGKPVIATSLGPHLDFTNNSNTLYVDSKFEKADKASVYWDASPFAEWIAPDLNDAVDKMIYMYNNHKSFNVDKQYYYDNYSWSSIVDRIISI